MGGILIGLKPEAFTSEQMARLCTLAGDREVFLATDEVEQRRVIDSIEIAAARIKRDITFAAPNLRWFQQWNAGIDWMQRYAQNTEIRFLLTNMSGVHAIPIAEHVFGYLLAFTRWLPAAYRAQHTRQWVHPVQESEIIELADKTMLLVGVGAIGRRIAEIARAFGMRVIGVRNHPERSDKNVVRMIGPNELRTVLPDADFIVLTVPGTNETYRMFGEAEFRAMKETAYFVNIGRGKVVDHVALERALREGWIRGAGLDVSDPEPLPEGSPLWDMENVIITGHYAGGTSRYNERAIDIFLDNLERYVNGKELRNVVDVKRGY